MNSYSAMKWLITAGIVIAVLLIVWKIRTPPRVGGEVIAQLPAQVQVERRTEARKITDQVNVIARQSGQSARAPFTLVITQQQLNTLMQDGAANAKSPIKEMRAEITSDHLNFQGTVLYSGMNVVATLSGAPRVEAGKLVYRADSLLMGGVSAPDNIRINSEKTATTQLNLLIDWRATVNSVTVQAGQLTIEGVTA